MNLKRNEDETFEDYRARQAVAAMENKRKLSGTFLHMGNILPGVKGETYRRPKPKLPSKQSYYKRGKRLLKFLKWKEQQNENN